MDHILQHFTQNYFLIITNNLSEWVYVHISISITFCGWKRKTDLWMSWVKEPTAQHWEMRIILSETLLVYLLVCLPWKSLVKSVHFLAVPWWRPSHQSAAKHNYRFLQTAPLEGGLNVLPKAVRLVGIKDPGHCIPQTHPDIWYQICILEFRCVNRNGQTVLIFYYIVVCISVLSKNWTQNQFYSAF